MRLVRRLADVLPHAEEVDRCRVLEALAGLDHRAYGPDPGAIDVPGIILPARARAMPFHTRRTVTELRFNTAAVEVRGLNNVRIGRDEWVRSHTPPPVLREDWSRAGTKAESAGKPEGFE